MLKSQQRGLAPLCSGEIPDLRHRPVLQEPACVILMGVKEAPRILPVAELRNEPYLVVPSHLQKRKDLTG